MAFYVDSQTLDDLNIFGRRGRDSVYGLFNMARTRGGGQVMDLMFRYPLSDSQQINRRSSVIRYMLESGMEFPFRSELFEIIEHYLSNTDTRTQLALHDNTLRHKLRCALGAEREYKQLQKGVLSAIEIVGTLKLFVERGLRNGGDNPYRQELEEFAEMVSDPNFESLIAEYGAKRLAYAKTAALDSIIRFRMRDKVKRILSRIYQLDVYIAVAEVAKRLNLTFAHALPDGCELDIEQMYHPQVRDAVPNSIKIDAGGNVVFLTGANMAGKSTFMKTFGLTIYLAHVGFPVPAASMRFPTLNGMYTTINIPDNLSIGYSHFYAEVMRVKKVAEALGKTDRLLVIFDELFRGTNVKDAYDATVAITQAFAGKPNNLFVISTHIIEAGDELRNLCDNVRFIYLPTVMEGNEARYPYTLREGITSDRHGMMIINNENVIEIIRRGGRGEDHATAGAFSVDRQTLEDLNLLGEYRQGSIFGLFNRTVTRGGKQLLDNMFREPLTDADRINERASVFAWFQRQGLNFPVTRERFDAAEQYLNAGSPKLRLVAYAMMFRRKALQIIVNDKEYAHTRTGLEAAVDFLRRLWEFTEKLDRRDVPKTIVPMLRELDAVFDDRRLAWVFAPTKPKSGWFTLAGQDYTLCRLFQKQVQSMMRTVYAFDLYLSVSGLAEECGFVYPKALAYDAKDNHIRIDGFYHPRIPDAVANNISINRDCNVVFLTGANMAGKSTLMKSFSIAVYLAHMGFPVAAKDMEFTVQEGIYTSINVSDDLIMGYSHFYAEVVRVKRVAEEVASGKNLVIVFDELFKGTNVKDAYDATVAVTDAFGDHRNCSFIISTHIIEAGHTLSADKDNLRFIYMPTVMKNGRPTYPYTLTPGITSDRHGMIIIQNEKILEIINNEN